MALVRTRNVTTPDMEDVLFVHTQLEQAYQNLLGVRQRLAARVWQRTASGRTAQQFFDALQAHGNDAVRFLTLSRKLDELLAILDCAPADIVPAGTTLSVSGDRVVVTHAAT